MTSFDPRRLARLLLPLAVLFAVVGVSRNASAYAWMIRHDYGGCNMCHADPGGGGLLTPYGRAQGEVLLRMRYGVPADEPGKVAEFAFGVLPLPEELLLGGDFRGLWYRTQAEGADATTQSLFMQADLQAQLTVDRFRANASVGYADQGALGQSITNNPTGNIISRLHWVGLDLGEDKQYTVRAGRMVLPFGLRAVEHNMWVRSVTRTDYSQSNQDGVSLDYNTDGLRAAVMLVAGNYNVHPDEFRDRGYVGMVEWQSSPKLALGAQSMILHAAKDLELNVAAWRHAHGVSARWAPVEELVVMAEADVLLTSQYPGQNDYGYAGVAQGDWEPVQGLHLMLTAEAKNQAPSKNPMSTAGWASVAWFFAPHADVRVDAIQQNIGAGDTTTGVRSMLAQLHFFL